MTGSQSDSEKTLLEIQMSKFKCQIKAKCQMTNRVGYARLAPAGGSFDLWALHLIWHLAFDIFFFRMEVKSRMTQGACSYSWHL